MEVISEVVSVPAKEQQNVFGQFDSHIKKLERHLKVSIVDRNGEILISGSAPLVKKAKAVIQELTELSMRGNIIQEQNVDYAITMSIEENEDVLLEIDNDCICHTISGKPIKPKTTTTISSRLSNPLFIILPSCLKYRSYFECSLTEVDTDPLFLKEPAVYLNSVKYLQV